MARPRVKIRRRAYGFARQISVAANAGSALLVLGDKAYNDGTAAEHAAHYAASWGTPAIKPVTFPCPGTHDYHTPGAAPYYAFVAGQAGSGNRGFYSVDRNGSHLVSLNTEEGYRRGSPQLIWLEADVRSHDTMPTFAFCRRPRFGSGGHSCSRAIATGC